MAKRKSANAQASAFLKKHGVTTNREGMIHSSGEFAKFFKENASDPKLQAALAEKIRVAGVKASKLKVPAKASTLVKGQMKGMQYQIDKHFQKIAAEMNENGINQRVIAELNAITNTVEAFRDAAKGNPIFERRGYGALAGILKNDPAHLFGFTGGERGADYVHMAIEALDELGYNIDDLMQKYELFEAHQITSDIVIEAFYDAMKSAEALVLANDMEDERKVLAVERLMIASKYLGVDIGI